MLGGRIGRREGARYLGGNGAVVDDAATGGVLTPHPPEGRSGTQERSTEVHGHHAVPRIDREFVHGNRWRCDSRVVEQEVDPTEMFHRGIEQPLNVGHISHISDHGQAVTGQRGRGVFQDVGGATTDHDGPTVCRECLGSGSTDAPSPTGHHGDPFHVRPSRGSTVSPRARCQGSSQDRPASRSPRGRYSAPKAPW